MRIREQDIRTFVGVLSPYIKGCRAELYLFGSRTEDLRRGGDIDLLVLSTPSVVSGIKNRRHFILTDFKKTLGDRRIDLTLAELAQASKDPFLRSALKTAVLLKKWRSRGP